MILPFTYEDNSLLQDKQAVLLCNDHNLSVKIAGEERGIISLFQDHSCHDNYDVKCKM